LPGAPCVLQPLDEQTVHLNVPLAADDILLRNVSDEPTVGVLVIDFATRRRIRLNGKASVRPNRTLLLTTQEVYGNCPKYIQARRDLAADVAPSTTPERVTSAALSDVQRQWIGTADTFFIASHMPGHGADASHRGGNAGFVRVIDANTLEYPDYSGNMMFNTLGNLAANPRSGLLFLGFETGSTLQLTGQSTIIWDAAQVQAVPGAERLVRFTIDEVHEVRDQVPMRFTFMGFSKHNPPTVSA
jgi:uncharacterized protein